MPPLLLLLLPLLLEFVDAAEDADEEDGAGDAEPDELLSEELLELPLVLLVDPALDDDDDALLSVR
ncbi:MAG TPA: hypothetical protein VFU65_18570 [Actinocrinis sp.]|nr:hypothetical protein [Actinocrinis sp.]